MTVSTRRPLGAVVGPLSPASVPASASASNDVRGDFVINGMPFRFAISDDRPYQRATAEFRKDQFDASSEVGDQSLTGWWRRSEFSFHRGAGINYYESLDGDVVANRFSDSTDVDVSVPGQVTLGKSWGSLLALANVTYAVPTNNGEALVYAASDVYCTTGAGPYVPTAGTSVQMAAGAAGNVFVATSSKKVESTTTALGAGTVQYTSTNNIVGLWYAKSRLWVMDASSQFYAVAPFATAPPVALGSGDLVCTMRESGGTWMLAEGPGAVYLAHSTGTIYAVTLDTDGSVPTLASPVEVARTPSGDTLLSLGYYLGNLIIQSAAGVRLGSVATDGSVALGPQFITSAQTGSGAIAGYGNKAYLATSTGVLSIDLSQPVPTADLSFAWVTEHAAANLRGVVTRGTQLVSYGTGGLSVTSTTTPASTGFLTTGQIRFGTLDPKQFQMVRVTVAGPAGSVMVSRVDATGAVTNLLSMNVASVTEANIGLNMTHPATSVGLRFDLTPVGTDSPKLLGYRLLALPAPDRQRLIRVPLLLQDTERRPATRAVGHAGSAWERLEALEDMERSGGIFQFYDGRTGEAGSCSIDAIEHEGKTPPNASGPAFGGTVYLTLRKL